MKEVTMRMVLAALVKELGVAEGKSVFEWYCRAYSVDVTSVAPATIAYEVFGI